MKSLIDYARELEDMTASRNQYRTTAICLAVLLVGACAFIALHVCK